MIGIRAERGLWPRFIALTERAGRVNMTVSSAPNRHATCLPVGCAPPEAPCRRAPRPRQPADGSNQIGAPRDIVPYHTGRIASHDAMRGHESGHDGVGTDDRVVAHRRAFQK